MDILHPLLRRKRAYQGLFGDASGGEARAVLADLKRFCMVPEAPVARTADGAVDPLASMRLVGRQEVFNRIRAMVAIDDRALFNLKEEAIDE
ncbi:hypothetical protein [Caulobacter sp. NIBR1757]|uniref:Bbp19 family protein n=1 Tax=Caulobacter sp. NIBR1757 TaxID=3016000 RepID=UPI0022F04CA7|nr:hypothetical protein [Caulobacter sp. NIBR1757]WGM40814.1 hypothetical protein AMEJIAPC_03761 [Caulobacter sp. NIBR1757]